MTKGNKDELIKSDILNAAQKLFQQYGLFKTTMEDIAQAAGKGKSTLYYYYKSKDEIFDAVLFLEIDDVFHITEEAVRQAESAEEKIRAYALTKFNAIQQKSNLYNIVSGELKDDFQLISRIRNRYNVRNIESLKNILTFGIKTDEFINMTEEHLDLTIMAMASAFRSIRIDSYLGNHNTNVEACLEHLTNMLIRSLKRPELLREGNNLISDIYRVN